jgi:hypothetical protein
MRIVVVAGAGSIWSNDAEPRKTPFDFTTIDNFSAREFLVLANCREIMAPRRGIFGKITFRSLFKTEIVY